MAAYHYERLSAMDDSFLASETLTTPMHLVGLQIFEAGPLRTTAGGIDIDRIRAAYRGVLDRLPRYRQKLMWIPVQERAVWVDDPHFRLDDHVRHVSLPAPGGDEELKRLASRLIANRLDRDRPLWEAWVIEGLEADRFAILSKTHHCMVDGSAGVEIAQLLLSASPDEAPAESAPWTARPAPTPAELFRDEALRLAGLPLRALRGLLAFGEVQEAVDDLAGRYQALQDFTDASLASSSPTPFNGPLGRHRRLDWWTLPLADVKAVRRKLGCTVNDVFLATVTQAFRETMREEGLPLDELVFRASMPVNLRAQDDHRTSGNQVANWFVTLPIGEPDRLAQVDAIRTETERLKASNLAEGMVVAMAVTEFVPAPLLGFASSFAANAINTIVTNVPGPQLPLYLLGAKLDTMIPGAPLLQNIGLGLAILSYDGTVFWGLTADPDLVPEPGDFVERLDASFRELAEATGVAQGDAPPSLGEPAAR